MISLLKKLLALTMFVFLAFVLCLPWIFQSQIERVLKTSFQGATVTVGHGAFEWPWMLSLSGLQIKTDSNSLTIKKITLDPKLRLVVQEPIFEIHGLPKQTLQTKTAESSKYFRIFPIRMVDVRDLTVRCDFLGVYAGLHGSFLIDEHEDSLVGKISIEKLTYQKLSIENMESDVVVKDHVLQASPLHGNLLGGQLFGALTVSLKNPFPFKAEIDFETLDLGSATHDFELEKKMSANGKLTGKISLSGNVVSGLTDLSGDFLGARGGGDLVIQDKSFLDRIAQNVHQPIELVEASFKEYHFDTAALAVSKNDRALDLGVDLDGPKGKRSFQIKLHDLL